MMVSKDALLVYKMKDEFACWCTRLGTAAVVQGATRINAAALVQWSSLCRCAKQGILA